MAEFIADIAVITVLCIARFVYRVDGVIEFWIPAWLMRWLDRGASDLTAWGTLLGVEEL